MRPLAGCLFALFLFSFSSPALARRYGGSGKSGPLMLNLKIGPAIELKNLPTQVALELDFGVALTGDRALYLVLAPQFHLANNISTIMVPLGIQYDIALPVPGLYLYPRVSMGYAASIYDYGCVFNYCATSTVHRGFALPEIGIKYVIRGRGNVGFEPFSLPIFFEQKWVGLQYRLLFYGGVNF
jgi:hypothetical protein